MKKYNDLTRIEKEHYLLLPILNELKKMGGGGTTTEVKKNLVENNDYLAEDVLTKTRTSENGNTYYPFNYPYNFAVTNLEWDGYIDRPKRGFIKLTEKGHSFTGSNKELCDLVYSHNDHLWKEKSTKNKSKKETKLIDYLNQEVEKQNTSIEDDNTAKITQAIDNLSPQKFETFCRALMKKMNVDIDEKIGVKMSGDGGLDGFGYMLTDDFRTTRVAIQAKHWNNNLVSSPEIDKFRGAMDKYRAEYGVFITTSNFTRSAIQTVRTGSRVITLIDGDKLTKLVIKYQLYVKPVTVYELDEDFFGDDNQCQKK